MRGIEEADEVLRFNIVQGSLNTKGNYDVKMTSPSHHVTVEAGQCETHGPALEPIDLSILGDVSAVSIDKVERKNLSKEERDRLRSSIDLSANNKPH